MGIGTLPQNKQDGLDVITAQEPNSIFEALCNDFVGRDNATRAATALKNLGTPTYPWANLYANNLVIDGQTLDTQRFIKPPNILISGKKRTTSSQSAFLRCHGSQLTAYIEAAATNLKFDINGTQYTLTNDITINSLQAAPSANNTCLVNGGYTGEWARNVGESDSLVALPYEGLNIDTVGSEISTLVGTRQTFRNNSTGEIFTALVETTYLHKCQRGFYFDSGYTPMGRSVLADNQTLTLLKTGYVFLDADLVTTDVSYIFPYYHESAIVPAGTSGQYWYVIDLQVWRRYNGTIWVDVPRVLLGTVCMSSSACIGSRAREFYFPRNETNDVEVDIHDSSTVRSRSIGINVYVGGRLFDKGIRHISWNIPANFATGTEMYNGTEMPSRPYYFYVKEDGYPIVSDMAPYLRRDFGGYYHPFNIWRCVGFCFNDNTSAIKSVVSTNKMNIAGRLVGSTMTIIGDATDRVLIFSANDWPEPHPFHQETFQVPMSGKYLISFDFSCEMYRLSGGAGNNTPQNIDFKLRVNGTPFAVCTAENTIISLLPNQRVYNFSISVIATLRATDLVDVVVNVYPFLAFSTVYIVGNNTQTGISFSVQKIQDKLTM